MFHIYSIQATEILDSRGHPTVETTVKLFNIENDKAGVGTASVPSGASTGSNEAVELRDNDPKRFSGKGVLKAVHHVNTQIADALEFVEGLEAVDRTLIKLDGTENKGNLGANAILSVSQACAKAMANSFDLPLFHFLGGETARTLPIPLMNVINGGVHANNLLDIQEFMIVPHGFVSFREALRAGVETFHQLKKLLQAREESTAVGDEGGFAPSLKTPEAVFELLVEAIQKAGYQPRTQIGLALDAAATELWDPESGTYQFKKIQSPRMGAQEFIRKYESWVSRYPLLSLEDPLSEEDWPGWVDITRALGGKMQIIGDDIFCTNPRRIQRGIDQHCANAVLIKPNQIGTLTETMEAVDVSREKEYRLVLSHRSGETESGDLAHIAVGLGIQQIKTGGGSRSDRMAKYNELLRIETALGSHAQFIGTRAFAHPVGSR